MLTEYWKFFRPSFSRCWLVRFKRDAKKGMEGGGGEGRGGKGSIRVNDITSLTYSKSG